MTPNFLSKKQQKSQGGTSRKSGWGCAALYSTANDPKTANDPQNEPQMILNRK